MPTGCGSKLKYVDCYKYLGFNISNKSKVDDLELRNQYRLLCCRTNSLIRKFSLCTYPVKRYLYSTYCANVCNAHLWHSHRASVLKKFVVCFNNAARMFFGYDRFCSASGMFAQEGIDNFSALYRKAAYRFLNRLAACDNRLISSLFYSDLAVNSSLRKVWSAALYSDTLAC